MSRPGVGRYVLSCLALPYPASPLSYFILPGFFLLWRRCLSCLLCAALAFLSFFILPCSVLLFLASLSYFILPWPSCLTLSCTFCLTLSCLAFVFVLFCLALLSYFILVFLFRLGVLCLTLYCADSTCTVGCKLLVTPLVKIDFAISLCRYRCMRIILNDL